MINFEENSRFEIIKTPFFHINLGAGLEVALDKCMNEWFIVSQTNSSQKPILQC